MEGKRDDKVHPPSTQPEPSTFLNNGNLPNDYPPPPYWQTESIPTPHTQQQSEGSITVVQQQPTVTASTVRPIGDYSLTLSFFLMIMYVICGTWYPLFCTIPAIIFANMARDADRRGDSESAHSLGRVALGFNIASIVFWFIGLIVIVILIDVSVSKKDYSNDNDCYYYDTYYC